ncbi:hypothetical protein TNCV_530601 [Trichonephila clavipes]|nr:hypothetical protein TNCV_530601 [Trichonephila clavipes]
MRRLVIRWLFGVAPCCKGTIHLQMYMPSSEFEKPNGTAVSVTNHYTGWAEHIILSNASERVFDDVAL